MKQSRTKDIFVLGFAMFAIFFGAGNLIFPPSIGIYSGADVIPGIAGLTLTGILFPMLAMYAVGNMGNDIYDLTCHISPWWHTLYKAMGLLVVLFGTIPRCGAVAAETGMRGIIPSLPDWGILLFLAIFFGISYFFASNRSKVIDMIGEYATPLLLISLLILIVMVFVIPIGSPSGGSVENAFTFATLTAYNTGDIGTGLICAGIFLGTIREKGYTDFQSQRSTLIKAIAVSFVILFVVYGGLCWLGACGTSFFPADMDQTALLNGLVERLAGRAGVVVLAVAVILACFTTAAGMIATVSDWILDWTKGKIPYRIIAFLVTLIIFLMSATGISNVLAFSGPIFTLMFPMSVVMTVLGVFKKFVPNDGAWKGAVFVASMISIYDAFNTARSSGLVSLNTDALDSLIARIPLSQYGFDWLLPTVAGFIAGAVIWKVLGRASKPDASLAAQD